ncbi:MAG: PEP-CTERM sorting domain-containing protein [Verrucomicrobiota bacterium JB022]|nr:PEP-CTERM sorting domain-containing protein [Verrucomicrobiota bacterium JB022]
MKRLILSTLSLLAAASAFASLSITFQFNPTAVDTDTFGLNGSTFTFVATTSQETYQPMDIFGFPSLTWDEVSLSITGSASNDGSYILSPTASANIYAIPSYSNTALLFLDDVLNYAFFDAELQFRIHGFSGEAASVTSAISAGDAVMPEHFEGLAFAPAVFDVRTLGDNDYREYNHDAYTVNIVAVPEPSTYAAIAGLGVLGLVAYRRKRA